jgi:hypothetical protein
MHVFVMHTQDKWGTADGLLCVFLGVENIVCMARKSMGKLSHYGKD